MKNNQETMSAAPETPANRPPNSIKVIPLDGPNKGIPTYQSMDSAFAPIRREQLNWAEAEINRLRAELAKYEASGRIVDTTYRISSDPPEEGSEVTVYRIELNDEFSAAGARLEMELLENEFGDGGFDSEMEYAEGLFDKQRMEAFHDLYAEILEGMVLGRDETL